MSSLKTPAASEYARQRISSPCTVSKIDLSLGLTQKGAKYYLSFTVVQGSDLHFNGTMEPMRLIDQGFHLYNLPLLHHAGNDSSCTDPPSEPPVVVSCTEDAVIGLS